MFSLASMQATTATCWESSIGRGPVKREAYARLFARYCSVTDIFAAFPARVLARMGADAGFFGFAQPRARREELCQRPAGRATAWASTVFLTSMVAPNTPAYDLRHF
ncbi:hypothetical protein GCM10010381_66840 [Streptomyces xantholiticus]|nr:hypothetical protein GCM10010381_66840 [Streptomyces xantholiticus]